MTLRISLAATLLAGMSVAVVNATAAAPPAVDAHGSVNQVYVTGLAADAPVTLLDKSGATVQTKDADSLGGAVFYNVPEDHGYRVQLADGTTSHPVTVHDASPAPWDPDVYNQSIPDDHYGYITTRDGTQLAYTVHPPTTPAGEGTPDPGPLPSVVPGAASDFVPPYPTLIEYSGYGYATPKGPTSGIAVLANAMGFAVVDVSMRGTGCSGGAFNFFEPLQNLDGYDVIETIAKQPWVKDHKVGMLGISYGAISQLFTAQLQPPSLEAITPLSTIDATATTLYPGGVLNTGFAVAWAKERQDQAQPAPNPGTQPYATDRINGGDTVCKNNQVLHGEAEDLMATIAANSHYNPAVADPLDPITFVDKIKVPVFMACQWTDEQTGGHCPDLAQHFTGVPEHEKWFTFTNGAHIDSLDPATYQRWYDFLELYVAHQAPAQNAAVTQLLSPVIYQAAMGLPQNDIVTMPPDPIQALPTYDLALAAYEKLPSVRVLFDNGAGTSPTGDTTPGNPYAGFEQSFPSWPIPGTATQRWYLGADGSLNSEPAATDAIDSYTSDPNALPKTDFGPDTGGGGLWADASKWEWNWKQNPAGTAVSYLTAPLTADTVVIGAGSVKLWVRSSAPDVDLQATISEVTPDGHETFVQNGWIRASERKLATDSNNILRQEPSDLTPVPTMLESDSAAMPSDGSFTEVTIPLYYEGHAYRAGTRIRVTIAAPNGTQPIWSFDDTQPAAGQTSGVEIGYGPDMPSSLVLPVIPNVTVPTAQPACPSLRNEPCRDYVAFTNRTEG